jgi:hypothetical protein
MANSYLGSPKNNTNKTKHTKDNLLIKEKEPGLESTNLHKDLSIWANGLTIFIMDKAS